MKLNKFLALAAVGGLFILPLLSSTSFGQGNLTPPGPPGPTMKTLSQIEPQTPISYMPYTITNPGSYYLTKNLTAKASPGGTYFNGIFITANDVTLDLRGFALIGNSTNSGVGILTGPLVNLAIRNGTITGWRAAGIMAYGTNIQFENVRLSDNGGVGLFSSSAENTITRCVVVGNGYGGIWAGAYSVVSDCVISGNKLYGLTLTPGSTATHCTACFNSGNGIVYDDGCTISGCTAYGNGGSGFSALASDGVGCTLIHCTARGNGYYGIVAGAGDGIIGNVCSANGSAASGGGGIEVPSGADNTRIDGNTVSVEVTRGVGTTSGDVGIYVNSVSNLVVRNVVSGFPTNYLIAPSNDVGTITSALGGQSLPWANASH